MCIEDHPSWKLQTIVDKIEEICSVIEHQLFGIVIVDESHFIKNRTA